MTWRCPFSRFVTIAFSVSSRRNNLQRASREFTTDSGKTFPPKSSPVTWSRLHSHSTAVSPIASSFSPEFTTTQESPDETPSTNLSNLCNLLSASPTDLLRLESTNDGVRGVFLNRPVEKGDIILSVPLTSCLQDDEPPEWLGRSDEEACAGNRNPSDWATRLAASLLNLQVAEDQVTDCGKGRSQWLSMMPDPTFLRASLPVHWSDDVVMSARNTALELARDSAYFARAEAVEDLLLHLRKSDKFQAIEESELRDMCQNALDLVQTRSCRVEANDEAQWGPPVRVIAPIFDFINHGSAKSSGTDGANACFEREGSTISDVSNLVVRATRDLNASEEVLIDYGDSARPSWKCLASYGFVPEYEEADEDDVAEVYLNGIRYDVGPYSVPFEMVEAVAASIANSEAIGDELGTVDEALDGTSNNMEGPTLLDYEHDESEQPKKPEDLLTPSVAIKIATRVTDVAFQLLLEPEVPEEGNSEDEDPALVQSMWLAASLRWSQHRILLRNAIGLRDWVTRQG